MTHVHYLDGCAPVPLAHYLKALGILRLVAEQADPQARGWWQGERFRLATLLSREELETFILVDYEPTPLVSPWNKGSGFFSGVDPALSRLEESVAARFEPFRQGIAAVRKRLGEIAESDSAVRRIKAECKEKGLSKAQKAAIRDSPDYKRRLTEASRAFARSKAVLIPKLRAEWRGPHREWMDAAMVLDGAGNPAFPSLLGTGGNDGRLDFTNNFMQRLGEVFDVLSGAGGPFAAAHNWATGSLWGEATPGCQRGVAIGQYLPGSAGGANNANGPEATSLVNPFDFLLMMEGTVLFTAHVTQRIGMAGQTRAAAPFSVSSQGAGYASAGSADEGARGEQWMPLWEHPTSLPELKRLLGEGRAQIGRRAATQPLDMARAIARLGVARGITSFQRYGYVERNGQSNLAVPLGRFVVPDHSSPMLACLDDLDAWLPRLHRAAISRNAPTRLALAERRLVEALFAVARHPDEPSRWQTVLLALAAVEAVQKHGAALAVGPVPKLRPEWAQAVDDGSTELRLALALALQRAGHEGPEAPWWNTTRRHWLPLDRHNPRQFAKSGSAHQARLQVGPEVVMHGRRGLDDAIALVERRLTEAAQAGAHSVPLVAARHAHASPDSLAAAFAGEVDLDRTLALARALMALDAQSWARQPPALAAQADPRHPDDAWLLIRLALLPWPLHGRLGGELMIGTDPAVFRRLVAGDAATAVELASRRLAAAGIRSAVRVAAVPPSIARVWAAMLAFPITQRTARSFLHRIDPTVIEKESPE